MAADLRAALERARDWERHHAPSVPRLYLSRSLEGRVADSITALAGSITFVDLHTVWFGLWVALNAGLLGRIGLSTFVMIAQNRLSDQADARARADYDVNLRAEAGLAKLVHLIEALVEHDVASHPVAGAAPGRDCHVFEMVRPPARVYRLAPAQERGERCERGLEAVGLGEHDLRTALRQALQAVGHPAAALTLVASQARTNPALDDAITLAMRQATWRQIVREELCGETGEPIG